MGSEVIRLRFAVPEDAPALLEIYRPYVEKTTISFETEVPSCGEFEERIRAYSRRFPYLVAEADGVPVGYAYAHPFHDRAAYAWTVESSIYVAENARGRHIGRKLYEALFALLHAQGIKNVCAVVTIPNEPSMAFHQRLGFQTGAVLPEFGFKLGAWCGVAYLYRSLEQNREGIPVPPAGIHDLPPELCRSLLE